jgi:hypothetical protein
MRLNQTRSRQAAAPSHPTLTNPPPNTFNKQNGTKISPKYHLNMLAARRDG